MRNPENCELVNYSLEQIAVYMDRKTILSYNACVDFLELPKRAVREVHEESINHLKDLDIIPFIVDPSNLNTYILCVKDKQGKTAVICGDFKNYDGVYGKDKLRKALSIISSADVVAIEGKYLGKGGFEHASEGEVFDKLKNIMKLYKQVYVIQSETDMIMAKNIYQAALKTKKIFIENSLLSNLATIANGSFPNPVSSKKVYSYNQVVLNNQSYEFKRKYLAPFTLCSAVDKMKKERYAMNITKDMLQDLQLFNKTGSLYDACVIFGEWKGFLEEDEEMQEFIEMMKKEYEVDYYELYTKGELNLNTLKTIIAKLNPKCVVPVDFDKSVNNSAGIPNFKVLDEEKMEI